MRDTHPAGWVCLMPTAHSLHTCTGAYACLHVGTRPAHIGHWACLGSTPPRPATMRDSVPQCYLYTTTYTAVRPEPHNRFAPLLHALHSQVAYADVLGVTAAQSHKLPYPIMTQVCTYLTERAVT